MVKETAMKGECATLMTTGKAVADPDCVADLFTLLSRIRESCALKRKEEIEAANLMVSLLGLPSHHDPQKDWDTLKCLFFVLALKDLRSPLLDVGASRSSVILNWLHRFGYEELYACDLRNKKVNYAESPIKFSIQDLSNTNFSDGFFQAVTSISVIEHGVDVEAYLKEMSRVLRPGGLLLTSTDYWSEPVDCRGIYPYGRNMPEMKVFQPHELQQLWEMARDFGLSPCGPLDLETEEQAIYWQRVDRRYTFAFIALVKRSSS